MPLVPHYPPDIRSQLQDSSVWEWISGITEAPDEDTFGTDSASAEMQGYLKDHTLLHDALAYFLGYSYVDPADTTTYLLKRRLPAFHPRWPWLRCVRVSIKGIKSNGQEESWNLQYPDSLPLPIYDRYRFHVFYEGLPYDVRSDTAVLFDGTGEWGRYLTVDPTDETEVIIQEGAVYAYDAPGSPFDTHAVQNTGLQTRAERTGLIVTSHGIAHDFILDSFNIPQKFLAAKGKVNQFTFLGNSAETMLLQSFKITKTPQPVATDNLDYLLFGLKVQMHFVYTNPTNETSMQGHLGWNLVPGPDRGEGTGWYYCKTPAAFGSRSLYGTYDMEKLLQHWQRA